MSRYLPFTLNRKISREDQRPVKTGGWRFNKQRWLRYQFKWRKYRGSGFCGRFAYLSKFYF